MALCDSSTKGSSHGTERLGVATLDEMPGKEDPAAV
jgi:hypothetical protein